MSKSGVYRIILKSDGRSYVGSSYDIPGRWRDHIYAAKRPNTKQVIARAIAKYGKDSFDWVVLESCTVDQLIIREQYWLDTIRPFADENNGFNVRKIADSNIGIKRTVESRKKQSKTMTNVPKSEEHKQHMRDNWHKNRGLEYYEQCRERMIGDKNPARRPEVADKISKSCAGNTWKDDKERVAKHIALRTGSKRDEKAKANMRSAQQKNNTRSAEAKEIFYLAQRKLYKITTPTGETFEMYSRELKSYCKDHNLGYPNLISSAKTGKPYKKGWLAKLIS